MTLSKVSLFSDPTSLTTSDIFGTPERFGSKNMSQISRKKTSLSDIMCLSKDSYEYVSRYFTPSPLPCANFATANAWWFVP